MERGAHAFTDKVLGLLRFRIWGLPFSAGVEQVSNKPRNPNPERHCGLLLVHRC